MIDASSPYIFVILMDAGIENCDSISEALKIIRNYCCWIPHYILLDQSGIEAKGIKKAFPGINAVTFMNPLESYHSELKRLTSSSHDLIGFQEMFEEYGYEGRESVIEFIQTKQQKEAEDRRLTVVELTERVWDRYWSVEEIGNVEKMEVFISTLETSLNPIFSKIDK
ncbi:hypothetical protein Glove_24g42 [Diversispora epigaea]|uniref:MULE transposase domain-containing protein n=1 Tax=Diversispora epigaea TaxID=1348612 RepID=A0A397JIS2_9GLOM|nr:hypothetical protein Glove_24g42 [Diversispora epigaea]